MYRERRMIRKKGEKMNILIVTHGHLAEGLKSSAEIIAGDIAQKITAISAYVDEGDYRESVQTYFEKSSEAPIVLTDLAGGSVNQYILSHYEDSYAALLTGVNLPLLLECLFLEDIDQIDQIIQSASQSLQQVLVNEEDDFDF